VILQYPIWLLLAIPLALSLWLWRPPSRLQLVLRSLALVLLVVGMCGLSLRLPSRAGTLVVVADRSQSMPPGSEAAQKEAIDLIQSAMDADDRLAVVSFGQKAFVDHQPQTGKFAGFVTDVGPSASNLAEGLQQALSLVPRDSPGKVFVLSDGRWTGGDPTLVASTAAARNIAIDYRCLQRALTSDLAVARLDTPPQVDSGEAFLITAWVQAPAAQTVSYELRRGDQVISSGEQAVSAGLNRLSFRDRAAGTGNQAYTLTVKGSGDDPIPENNTARVLVGIQGPRPLLHVSNSGKSGLARLLQGGSLQVKEQKPEECRWTLEDLSRFSGVVLENVPAEQIGNAGMATLAAWVRETGAGLMMTGGRTSYGTGGYYKSPLEDILPVTMELRNEHRKLALAIVVVLDRSGSMAIPVSGGMKKMDLANKGTVSVLDLLGPIDEFGVIAVDSVPHTVADLAPVRDKEKEKVRNDVLHIESMGGGIFIYEGLAAGAKMLVGAKAGTRHMILFADANDSEEPGNYKELVDKCKSAGMTISVIGLGTDHDHDAELLKDIASRGKGRIFFTDKPEELPRLFAQDTFVVARNTFLDEPTPIQSTAGMVALAGKPFDLALNLGGYNLCYLRPEATLGTVTLDEYKAPVVAAWQAGAGRVVCYTGEADGRYAGDMPRWKQVGDYFSSLARWTTGQGGDLGKGMMLTQEVKNGVNVIQLHLDPDRKGEEFSTLPQVSLLRSRPANEPEVRRTTLHWSGPDTLSIEVPLETTETSLATVTVPGRDPVALPPVCLPYSPEFAPSSNDRGLQTLDRLARATGGKERVDLPGIWKELPRQVRMIPVGHWLPILAVLLLLLEVLERRTLLLSMLGRRLAGAMPRRIAFRRSEVRPAVPAAAPAPTATPIGAGRAEAPTAAVSEEPVPPPVAAAAPPQPVEKESEMLDALQKARQKSRRRLE
jgi:Mg-chelatase subunit ChlD